MKNIFLTFVGAIFLLSVREQGIGRMGWSSKQVFRNQFGTGFDPIFNPSSYWCGHTLTFVSVFCFVFFSFLLLLFSVVPFSTYFLHLANLATLSIKPNDKSHISPSSRGHLFYPTTPPCTSPTNNDPPPKSFTLPNPHTPTLSYQ